MTSAFVCNHWFYESVGPLVRRGQSRRKKESRPGIGERGCDCQEPPAHINIRRSAERTLRSAHGKIIGRTSTPGRGRDVLHHTCARSSSRSIPWRLGCIPTTLRCAEPPAERNTFSWNSCLDHQLSMSNCVDRSDLHQYLSTSKRRRRNNR